MNACQHVSLEREVKPGIVAIVAPNGAGKSNLMHLVRASVTNTYNAMAGKKADNIYRLAAADEPSYVETEWQVSAGRMLIRRSFRNSDAGLWLNNERLVGVKNDDITAKALELAGVQQKVFDEFLFANVAQLTCVANGSKEARVELIQPLCGLERLAVIDRYLRDSAVAHEAVINAFDQGELDKQTDSWSRLQHAIKTAAQQYAALSDQLPSVDYVADQRRSLVAFDTRKEQRRELSLAIDRKRKAKSDRDASQLVHTEAVALAAAARKESEAAFLARDRYRAAVAANVAYIDYLGERTRLQGLLEADPPTPPVKPDGLVKTVSELGADYVYAKQQHAAVTKAIAAAADEKTFNCGTCRSTVEVTQDYLDRLKAELSQWSVSRKQIAAELHAAEHYDTAVTAYETASRWHQKMVAEAESQLQKLVKPQDGEHPPEGTLVEHGSLANVKAAARDQADSKLKDAANRLATAEARLAAAAEDVARRKASLGASSTAMDKSQVIAARKLLAAYDDMDAKRKVVANELARLRGQASEVLKQVRRLRADRRRLANRAQWLDVLQRSRSALKRDRLPSRVIAVMLRRTTKQLNEYLLKLNVPFSATADPEQFSFLIRHKDGTREPANRLSTGQSLCLGVAFWLARSDVFAGQLPLFWFDEPVANLDAERTVQVAELFGRLGEELASNGRQGIVITHDEAIAKTATQVIQL